MHSRGVDTTSELNQHPRAHTVVWNSLPHTTAKFHATGSALSERPGKTSYAGAITAGSNKKLAPSQTASLHSRYASGDSVMESQNAKRTGYRWIVLTMIFIVYMIAGADRANIGVVIPYMKSEFHLTNTEIGSLTSLFYLTYAAVQIPAGYLFGKFGIRGILVGSVVVTSIATLFTGMVTSVFQLKASRALLGLAEGPINIGIVSTINRWFPPQEKGLAAGVFMSAVKFAPAFVPPVCAFLIYAFGWRHVFTIFAIPGLFAAALWYWLVKDDPSKVARCSAAEVAYIKADAQSATAHASPMGIMKDVWFDKVIRGKNVRQLTENREIFRSWNLWGCAFGYFLLVGITYTIMTWVPTYLVTVKHFSVMKMGFVASAPWVGAIFGNLLGGWLSDRVFSQRRKPVMMITSAATVVMMYLMLYAPSNPVLLAALFFTAGTLLNLGYSTFLVYPMGLVAKKKIPFAASIVNTCGSIGGAFAPFVVGLILDTLDWDWVFRFLALSAFLTFGILCSIVEPRARNTESEAAEAVVNPRGALA
jgi:ACS family glucarate transporter-like MFS transporter